jgi:hypothetical protein
VNRINLAQGSDWWWALVNVKMKLGVPKKAHYSVQRLNMVKYAFKNDGYSYFKRLNTTFLC